VAYDGAGKKIAAEGMPGYEVVIQVPPGSGASVDVKVDMLACGWETCPYAIQTFKREG